MMFAFAISFFLVPYELAFKYGQKRLVSENLIQLLSNFIGIKSFHLQ